MTFNKDIDAYDLCNELQELPQRLPPKPMSPSDVLFYSVQQQLEDCVLNVVSLRILLTLPVSETCGERGFPKLQLIKTYLRSMSQSRLVDLVKISIEF